MKKFNKMVKIFLQTEGLSLIIGTPRYCSIKRVNGRIAEYQYIIHYKSTKEKYEYVGCESSYGHVTINKTLY